MRPLVLPLAASAWASIALAQPPAPPVFGARVESVYVDAFVTRDGKAVRGLRASDFELKDDGVVQAIDLVTGDEVPLLAVLAFDASASVAGPKVAALQAAGAAFLDGLKAADQAALLTFNEEIRWAGAPTAEKSRIKEALAALQPRGGTAVRDALYAAITVPTSRARSLVVLFSDGEDNMSWLDEPQLRTVAERSNALVHVVGIARPSVRPVRGGALAGHSFQAAGEDVHDFALRRIAEATGGRFWTAESPDRLRQTFAAIAEAMGHRYILRFEPPAGRKPGWHRVELELRNGAGRIEARRGYWVADRRPVDR